MKIDDKNFGNFHYGDFSGLVAPAVPGFTSKAGATNLLPTGCQADPWPTLGQTACG